MIKVSILCATYNHKNFIRQTLDSFLMQKTDFKYEVIIHDDASTDGTTEIIKEYAAKHPDIFKPIFQKENQYSKGIRWFTVRYLLPNAKGEYLALCEGDDYWTDANKLQMQVDFLDNNPDYALCFHPVRVFYENNEKEESVFPDLNAINEFTTEQLLKGNFIQTNSVMYRRQEYHNLPTNIMPGDWYLHLYHAKFGKIGFINRVMSAYRRHPGGIWWDSYDIEKLLITHGLNHFNFFDELLTLYGDSQEYKSIIWAHMRNFLFRFINIDENNNEEFFETVIKNASKNALQLLVYYGYIRLNEVEQKIELNDRERILLYSILNFYSWKIGRIITLLPRLIRRILNKINFRT